MKKFKRKVDNKMKGYGDIDLKKHLIRINKKRNKASGVGEMLDTIVHEELHRAHPKMKEKTVVKRTTSKVKKLSTTQKHRLYSKYHV